MSQCDLCRKMLPSGMPLQYIADALGQMRVVCGFCTSELLLNHLNKKTEEAVAADIAIPPIKLGSPIPPVKCDLCEKQTPFVMKAHVRGKGPVGEVYNVCGFCAEKGKAYIEPVDTPAQTMGLGEFERIPDGSEPKFKIKEADPTGRKPSDAGAKLDQGKNRMGLVLGGFSRALEAVSRIGTFGANKYSDNGWMSVPKGVERYSDALLRHMFKHLQGEVVDKDSGMPHLWHMSWNSLAITELTMRKEANELPIPIKTGEVAGEATRHDNR